MFAKAGIIIQARMSSSRLPGKSLVKIGNHPLIWYVLNRMKSVNLPVMVCTSTDSSDDVLTEYLQILKIPFFRGSLHNVLDRYIKTAQKFQIEDIIRVTGDNPFVDIGYLKQVLHLLEKFSYVDGIYKGGLIKGSGFELVKLKELLAINSAQKEHLEHVTLFLRENLSASKERINLIPTSINQYRSDIFLTCDYEEDMELIKKIYKNFYFAYNIPLKEIITFLDQNPRLKQINQFRHLTKNN